VCGREAATASIRLVPHPRNPARRLPLRLPAWYESKQLPRADWSLTVAPWVPMAHTEQPVAERPAPPAAATRPSASAPGPELHSPPYAVATNLYTSAPPELPPASPL